MEDQNVIPTICGLSPDELCTVILTTFHLCINIKFFAHKSFSDDSTGKMKRWISLTRLCNLAVVSFLPLLEKSNNPAAWSHFKSIPNIKHSTKLLIYFVEDKLLLLQWMEQQSFKASNSLLPETDEEQKNSLMHSQTFLFII